MTKTKISDGVGGSKKFFGVEFAPTSIPLSRRLETAAALFWTLSLFCFPIFWVFLYLILGLEYFLLVSLFYSAFYIYDWNTCNKGGRRFDFMRRLPVWNKLRDYFPAKLVKTTELDPSKNYLFGYHPHGILSIGCSLNFGTEATNISKVFPGVKINFLTLKSNFILPIFRDYIMSLGGCSVTRESMNYILSKPGGGNGAIVVVGGAKEAIYSQPNSQVLHLKEKKGFIKVAIQNGAQLVPVFTFGETEVILQVNNSEGTLLRKLQEKFLAVTGYAPVLLFGRGIFQYSYGLLPIRRPLTTVVGAPIPVTQKMNPSQEEIDLLHSIYVDELLKLFYSHRDKYTGSDMQLIVS